MTTRTGGARHQGELYDYWTSRRRHGEFINDRVLIRDEYDRRAPALQADYP